MLTYMVIREATAEDWPVIWPILREVGTAGETLTWDSARTEARARSGWMREPPGRTIALCRHVLEQARADGYRAMQFNAVVETNTPAIRLWRSFGFQILATVPEAFRHPLHGYVGLHIMYKPL